MRSAPPHKASPGHAHPRPGCVSWKLVCTWERDNLTILEGLRMPPTLTNGKICYIEIPSTDMARSADFYTKVFGWNIRKRGDGHLAFDDTTGQVSGTWVLGRPPASQPGLLIYIM